MTTPDNEKQPAASGLTKDWEQRIRADLSRDVVGGRYVHVIRDDEAYEAMIAHLQCDLQLVLDELDRLRTTPQPAALSEERLAEWVTERMENCLRIAGTKSDADKGGWIEDAEYFRQILAHIRCTAAENAMPAEREAELVATTVEECAKVPEYFIPTLNPGSDGFSAARRKTTIRWATAILGKAAAQIRSLHPDAATILAKRDARVRLAVEQELIAATPAEQVIKDSKRDTWLVASGRASEAYRTLGLAAPLNNDDAKDSPSVKLFIELLTARATELDALEAALSPAAPAKD